MEMYMKENGNLVMVFLKEERKLVLNSNFIQDEWDSDGTWKKGKRANLNYPMEPNYLDPICLTNGANLSDADLSFPKWCQPIWFTNVPNVYEGKWLYSEPI